MKLKDDVLVELNRTANVAQFVSFSPGDPPRLRHMAMRDSAAVSKVADAETSIQALLGRSASGSVNVRSFKPESLSGNPFHYGITDPDAVIRIVTELAHSGFYTIVNETIDVDDGGVSGVYQGGVLEFAPGSTPRAVEGSGHVSIPVDLGLRLLETIYGFEVELGPTAGRRIEFSVHPLRVGTQATHVLLWEVGRATSEKLHAELTWPNSFSHVIGDKVFGLLVADLLGFHVPQTKVFPRSIAPFVFGRPTGSAETWLRTSPKSRTPGKFTTVRGWVDPFRLLAVEDPTGENLASVLAQDGVDAAYSGAATPLSEGDSALVEGVAGFGDAFMLGELGPELLPADVESAVSETWTALAKVLGPVSFEWAFDGRDLWILQLHLTRLVTEPGVFVRGKPRNGWLTFVAGSALDDLKELIHIAKASRKGIEVVGKVGLTSHVGDLLRQAGIPSRLVGKSGP